MKIVIQDEPITEIDTARTEWTYNTLKLPNNDSKAICIGDHNHAPIPRCDVINHFKSFGNSLTPSNSDIEIAQALIRNATRSKEAIDELFASQGMYKSTSGAKEIQHIYGFAILIILKLTGRSVRLNEYEADRVGLLLNPEGTSTRSLREYMDSAASTVNAITSENINRMCRDEVANLIGIELHQARQLLLQAAERNDNVDSIYQELKTTSDKHALKDVLKNMSFTDLKGVYTCYSARIRLSISRTK